MTRLLLFIPILLLLYACVTPPCPPCANVIIEIEGYIIESGVTMEGVYE